MPHWLCGAQCNMFGREGGVLSSQLAPPSLVNKLPINAYGYITDLIAN